ncbi:MAG: hypothetical protein MJ119_02505 [Lachnospiraceae bacterium]|nr:hypothetical protein [Lachnospiraceae bacterium]
MEEGKTWRVATSEENKQIVAETKRFYGNKVFAGCAIISLILLVILLLIFLTFMESGDPFEKAAGFKKGERPTFNESSERGILIQDMYGKPELPIPMISFYGISDYSDDIVVPPDYSDAVKEALDEYDEKIDDEEVDKNLAVRKEEFEKETDEKIEQGLQAEKKKLISEIQAYGLVIIIGFFTYFFFIKNLNSKRKKILNGEYSVFSTEVKEYETYRSRYRSYYNMNVLTPDSGYTELHVDSSVYSMSMERGGQVLLVNIDSLNGFYDSYDVVYVK